MDDDQIQEAKTVANFVVMMADLLPSIGYSVEQWLEELQATVEYIKSQAAAT